MDSPLKLGLTVVLPSWALFLIPRPSSGRRQKKRPPRTAHQKPGFLYMGSGFIYTTVRRIREAQDTGSARRFVLARGSGENPHNIDEVGPHHEYQTCQTPQGVCLEVA